MRPLPKQELGVSMLYEGQNTHRTTLECNLQHKMSWWRGSVYWEDGQVSIDSIV